MLPRIIVILAAGLALGGCVAATPPPLQTLVHDEKRYGPEERFRGILHLGFETSAFLVPGDGTRAWVEAGPTVSRRIAEAAPEIFRPPAGSEHPISWFNIVFTGRRSLEAGRFGHLGAYRQQVLVTRIHSLRRRSPPPFPRT